MKRYFSNARMNKAALILASMSPDMVADIIDLVNSRGRSLTTELSAENGPVRPYAIFSREYINDDDFPEVFLGMTTIFLSTMRKLKSDNDFYETVLRQAFYLPASMAAAAAKKIETLDIIGGSQGAIDNQKWYGLIGARFQEAVRRTVNFVPSALGINWENDQNQKYDIDFLYEVKQLGKVVDDLQSRANLMRGQAQVSAELGIFNATSGIYGDVLDQVDPADKWEIAIGDLMENEMGFLPLDLLGGLKKLFKRGKDQHDSNVKQVAEKAGLTGRGSSDPDAREAAQRVLSGNPGRLMEHMSTSQQRTALENAIAVMQSVHDGINTGDVFEKMADDYGDVVANEWRSGNIPGMMSNVIEMAGDAFETTGDPELDEAIIGDVLGDIDAEWGDVEGATDSEFGGLFKRARANAKLRKAARRARRAARKASKINRKNEAEARLIAAREAANSAALTEEMITPIDSYLQKYRSQGAQLNGADPEMAPYFSSDGTIPDDIYNPNSQMSEGPDPFFMDLANPGGL